MMLRLEEASGVLPSGEMTGKAFAERVGVAHGTVKRWLHEGMPCRRDRRNVWIAEADARAWITDRYPNSVAVNRKAVVYFAQRSDGQIKIGWTSDVMRRVHELRKKYRCPVELLACIPGGKPDELAIQNRFADEHIGDERFRPSEKLLAFIAALGRSAA